MTVCEPDVLGALCVGGTTNFGSGTGTSPRTGCTNTGTTTTSGGPTQTTPGPTRRPPPHGLPPLSPPRRTPAAGPPTKEGPLGRDRPFAAPPPPARPFPFFGAPPLEY